ADQPKQALGDLAIGRDEILASRLGVERRMDNDICVPHSLRQSIIVLEADGLGGCGQMLGQSAIDGADRVVDGKGLQQLTADAAAGAHQAYLHRIVPSICKLASQSLLDVPVGSGQVVTGKRRAPALAASMVASMKFTAVASPSSSESALPMDFALAAMVGLVVN